MVQYEMVLSESGVAYAVTVKLHSPFDNQIHFLTFLDHTQIVTCPSLYECSSPVFTNPVPEDFILRLQDDNFPL